MSTHATKAAADVALAASWAGWLVSCLVDVNEILRTILLIVSIVAGIFTARYYYKRTKSLRL